MKKDSAKKTAPRKLPKISSTRQKEIEKKHFESGKFGSIQTNPLTYSILDAVDDFKREKGVDKLSDSELVTIAKRFYKMPAASEKSTEQDASELDKFSKSLTVGIFALVMVMIIAVVFFKHYSN